MLNSKKVKFKNLSAENEENSLSKAVSAFEMPALLSSISTGLDVHQIELNKLNDAPDAWNFYSTLSESKMTELIESIRELGLMHPVVVWEQMDGSYMILSGHNRKKAYELLLEETSDDKYKKIYCYVKKQGDITEAEAKEIIIDTNWVQRELSPIEKAKSIYQKYTSFKSSREGFRNKNYQGKTRDLVAKQFEITGRQVSDYYKLNDLTPEFKELLEANRISIKAGVRLAQFDGSTQKFIYDNYNETLHNKIILKLETSFSQEEISEIFSDYMEDLTDGLIHLSYKFTLTPDVKESFDKDLHKIFKKYGIHFMNR